MCNIGKPKHSVILFMFGQHMQSKLHKHIRFMSWLTIYPLNIMSLGTQKYRTRLDYMHRHWLDCEKVPLCSRLNPVDENRTWFCDKKKNICFSDGASYYFSMNNSKIKTFCFWLTSTHKLSITRPRLCIKKIYTVQKKSQ